MRFMMITNATKDSEAGKPPDPRLMAAVVKLTEDLTKASVLVSTGERLLAAHRGHHGPVL